VIEFSRYLFKDRRVSLICQNIKIISILFYFKKVLGGRRKLYFVELPGKKRILPAV
jgi:integrase/recombinase XerD